MLMNTEGKCMNRLRKHFQELCQTTSDKDKNPFFPQQEIDNGNDPKKVTADELNTSNSKNENW